VSHTVHQQQQHCEQRREKEDALHATIDHTLFPSSTQYYRVRRAKRGRLYVVREKLLTLLQLIRGLYFEWILT
jgi:hypothetical protein